MARAYGESSEKLLPESEEMQQENMKEVQKGL